MAHLCSQFPCLITGPLLAVEQQPLAAPAQGVTATQGNATYFEVHQSWCGVAGVPGANGVYGVCGTLATSKSAGDPGHAISMVGAPDRVVGSSSWGVCGYMKKRGALFCRASERASSAVPITLPNTFSQFFLWNFKKRKSS